MVKLLSFSDEKFLESASIFSGLPSLSGRIKSCSPFDPIQISPFWFVKSVVICAGIFTDDIWSILLILFSLKSIKNKPLSLPK